MAFDQQSSLAIKCKCGNEFTKKVEHIMRDKGAKCFSCGRKLFSDPERFQGTLTSLKHAGYIQAEQSSIIRPAGEAEK